MAFKGLTFQPSFADLDRKVFVVQNPMTSDSRAPEDSGRGQTEISTEIFAEIVAAQFFYRYRKCSGKISVETEQNARFSVE